MNICRNRIRRSSSRREAECPTRRGTARKEVFTATVSSALLLFFGYKDRFEPKIIMILYPRKDKGGMETEPPLPFKSSSEN